MKILKAIRLISLLTVILLSVNAFSQSKVSKSKSGNIDKVVEVQSNENIDNVKATITEILHKI
jgi:hypothetical protein